MRPNFHIIKDVPTNIITGFLGVGKTSAILHLLKSKPQTERWAILVNEFGEIGIDGSLIQGKYMEEQGVFIREVPGGCMCCTSGLPMQIALTQLLVMSKPDRLIIEPTGLGHPEEVLQTLSGDNYKDMLDIQKIVTLVDARKVSDPRYREHETFRQQIQIADTVVGNKQDLYADGDKAALDAYVKEHCAKNVELLFTEQGVISAERLVGGTESSVQPMNLLTINNQNSSEALPLDAVAIPECGYLKATNSGEGFQSVGWRFSSDKTFDKDKLFVFLNGVIAERLKAVFITDSGIFGYNSTEDALTEVAIKNSDESRIEIIATDINVQMETQLMACLIN